MNDANGDLVPTEREVVEIGTESRWKMAGQYLKYSKPKYQERRLALPAMD